MSKLTRKKAPAPPKTTSPAPAPETPVENKVTPLFNQNDVFAMGQEYAELSAQKKRIEDRLKFLSTQIKDGAEKFGVKDDKGSFYLENETLLLGRVAKKSFSFCQERAVQTLEASGLGDVVDVVTVKTVNEEKLTAAVSAGRISLNVVEGFTDVNTTYAVTVKSKEAMPEVQTGDLSAAASKK